MKVVNSLRSFKKRHKDSQIVRRRGRVYVINKTNPRFKARQGSAKKKVVPAFAQLVVPGTAPGAPAGGLRFGPFSNAFRVGTDPRKAQIVLDATGNVLPEHAVVTLYPNGVFGVEPAPGAGLWLAVQGQGQVWPIQSAVQVNPGDHLIFGSPGGPRFVLQVEAAEAARSGVTAALPGQATASWAPSIQGPRPGLGSAVGNEVVRQGTARLLARPGPIREAYYLWMRLRGGSLTSPYVLVSVLFGVVAVLATGTASCTGILSTIWWKLTYH